MRLIFTVPLLPLLTSVAIADISDRGLDIRVVKENPRRGTGNGFARRAEKAVVTTYAQCEQVCVSRLISRGIVRKR